MKLSRLYVPRRFWNSPGMVASA